ncbi:phage tail sheath subtilisin-like domain-containing protein [Corallococcus sp. BB11-1]|uniref:phage tail sheath C-terminal domain-containing protein n=1 Tax=Corallococcus sp. BB11-1 TaxID=2996783 RepID=UPI00226D423D|nr:phage tail sheath C-terminal domain-containing protein [Corallococcus sp. BB11-1]MCY1033725.1 phage tail sheath subtilisin-like domain-containing protein [Corallococcus sp. BB11-1]
MPERLHPGVYVEEKSAGARPIEGVGTSTAAFVGEAARGIPGMAWFLTGFAEYERAFGGHQPGEAGLLAQAVEAFFDSGGRRAYVVRVLPSDAAIGASVALASRAGGGLNALTFLARGAGVWSEFLRVHVADSTNFPGEAFRVDVVWTEAGATRTLETFDDLRMDPSVEDYVGERINDISRYIRIRDEYQVKLAASPSGTVLVAGQVPRLKAVVPASGKYTLYDGAKLQVVTSDAAQPDVEPTVMDIPVTQALVVAAVPAATFSNGKVLLTAAELKTFLGNAVSAAALTGTFVIEGTDAPEIALKVAAGPTLSIAKPVAPATSYDLDAEDLELTLGAPDGNTVVPIPITAADTSAVTPEELRASLAAALAGKVTSVVIASGGNILVTGLPTAGGTTTLASSGTGITGTPTAGSAGLTSGNHDGLQLSISETLQPTVPPMLRQLGFPPRARGYAANSPANPLVRPVSITHVRLLGGSDGSTALDTSDFAGDVKARTGLHALDGEDINLVALPGKNEVAYISAGIAYCDNRGDCLFLADGPGGVDKDFAVAPDDAKQFIEGLPSRSKNSAMFYPWIRVVDPVGVGRNPTRLVPPSGHVAGLFARTDNTRGVWKAPAGIEASISEALGLQYPVIDREQDILNPVHLNCLRQFPGVGIVSWGSRTLSPDPEWRYIPVRRTALFLKESLRRGLRWAVFEPNDEDLWSRIRNAIQAFMLGLYRQGAFQGATPEEAFSVVCDRSTNPQENVDAGIVTAQVSFAPLKPAEFVVLEISQQSQLVA